MILVKHSNLTFILAMLYLLIAVQSINWQGYGNMSSSNLTTIWGYITPRIDGLIQDAFIAQEIQGSSQSVYINFCTSFSDYLNEQWHHAWNIFVIISSYAGKDTILYGYAFREHWMWYNGYVSSNGFYVTFIIWKDYNCQVWTNIARTGGGTLNKTSIAAALVGVNSVNPGTDIWGKTKKFMNNLVTKDGFSGDDKAFSIIASEEVEPKAFFGRACLAGATKYFTSMTNADFYSSTPSWGSISILQMR